MTVKFISAIGVHCVEMSSLPFWSKTWQETNKDSYPLETPTETSIPWTRKDNNTADVTHISSSESSAAQLPTKYDYTITDLNLSQMIELKTSHFHR